MEGIIRLYLLGYKGFIALKSIHKDFGAKLIKEVIIGKDNGIDNDYFKDIEEFCINESIVCKPRLSDTDFDKTISIAIGWKWIIDLNRITNLIILHDSLLPKYRGFNPLVTALINGDREIGVTALFATEAFDNGEIIYQAGREINYPIKIQEAIEIITNCYNEIAKRIISDILNSRVLPKQKQDEALVSYSLWRDDDDYHIEWNRNAIIIKRFIDSVGKPYKGAYSLINEREVTINEVEVLEDINIVNRCPGKIIFIINDCPIVVCGNGLIKILKMTDRITNQPYKISKFRTRFL